MDRSFESCEHLQLIPNEYDAKEIRRYIQMVDSGEIKFEEMLEFLYGLRPFGRYYEPHCKKLNGLCVCMESPVIAMQYTGRLDQSIYITLINSGKIRRCPDREKPETNYEGKEEIEVFLMRRVLPQFAEQQTPTVK